MPGAECYVLQQRLLQVEGRAILSRVRERHAYVLNPYNRYDLQSLVRWQVVRTPKLEN